MSVVDQINRCKRSGNALERALYSSVSDGKCLIISEMVLSLPNGVESTAVIASAVWSGENDAKHNASALVACNPLAECKSSVPPIPASGKRTHAYVAVREQ